MHDSKTKKLISQYNLIHPNPYNCQLQLTISYRAFAKTYNRINAYLIISNNRILLAQRGFSIWHLNYGLYLPFVQLLPIHQKKDKQIKINQLSKKCLSIEIHFGPESNREYIKYKIWLKKELEEDLENIYKD